MKNIRLLLVLLSIMSCVDNTKKTKPQEENAVIEIVETEIEAISKVDTNLYDNMSMDEKNKALLQASENGHIEIVKYLIENNADISAKNSDGWTALFWASQKGHTEIVKILIESGADVNIKNKDGNTALIWASKEGRTEVVKLLKAAGGHRRCTDVYRIEN